MRYIKKRWWLIPIFLIGISLLAFGSVYLLGLNDEYEKAYVISVIDGDTILLENGEYVRLIGIDAPEKSDEFYYEAKDALYELVYHKDVLLEKDKENRDDYGRLLRYVRLGQIFVNLNMIERGYATSYPYPPNTKYLHYFDSAEYQARNAGLGIWNKEAESPNFITDPTRHPRPWESE